MVHIALIPAYKPTEVLCRLVKECGKNGLAVVVVADGSGEDYKGLFDAFSGEAAVLRHKEKQRERKSIKDRTFLYS